MKIDLGCSIHKKDSFVGIDVFDWSDKYPADEFLQGEVPDCLHNFKDNSIEEVRASHFIEHVPQTKVIEFMNEAHRILIPGGIMEINVPPSTGRGAFCDPTHVSFWNDMSFRYYDKSWAPELTGSYGITADFITVKMELLSEFDLHVILKKR